MSIEEKAAALSPWYQTLKVGNFLTRHGVCVSGECLWTKLKTLLPLSMKGMHVLDLGCNAGFYSVQAALRGAEVVGVEWDALAYKQALFLKDYFQDVSKKTLNINYLKEDAEHLDFDKLGSFDYIFALAVLYHIGDGKIGITPPPKGSAEATARQEALAEKMVLHGRNIIIRARRGVHSLESYNRLFLSFGCEVVKNIPKKARGLGLYASSST